MRIIQKRGSIIKIRKEIYRKYSQRMYEDCLLIAGGGRFGKKAIDYGKENAFKIILIDINPDCISMDMINFQVKTIPDLLKKIDKSKPGDLIFLNENSSIINELIQEFVPEIIIPVVPIHLLANLIKSRLNEREIELNIDVQKTKKVTQRLSEDLILNSIPEKGVIYLSWAKNDEVCPTNCIGPPNYCPNFKREKPTTITNYLRKFFGLDNSINIDQNQKTIHIVVESQQLKAGLGGLLGKEIAQLIQILESNLEFLSKSHVSLSIGTTCNCHGVVNFYKK